MRAYPHRRKVVFFLMFLLIMLTLFLKYTCGSGGGSIDSSSPTPSQSSGTTSEEFVNQLVTLESKISGSTISTDQFLSELDTITASIDTTSAGVSDLKQYLEESVSGYSFSTSQSTRSSNALKAESGENLLTKIKATSAYQMLEAFLSSVIFSAVPSPAAELIQVADPTTFVTLSTVQVRTHISDALFSGKIEDFKAGELYELNRTNPYEAERQLLIALGQSIPDWLQPAPQTCLRNCATQGGTYTGSFSKGGSFSRSFPETTCTWTITFTGTTTLTLTMGTGSTVSGSARVNGTETVTAISGTVPARICETGTSYSFDDTGTVSGNTASMTWTTDLSGGSGAFMGTFTGALDASSISGNIAVSYSNGSGALTIPQTLTKQ